MNSNGGSSSKTTVKNTTLIRSEATKMARMMRNVMLVWRETLSYRGNTMKPLMEHREINCDKMEEDGRPEGTGCTR